MIGLRTVLHASIANCLSTNAANSPAVMNTMENANALLDSEEMTVYNQHAAR